MHSLCPTSLSLKDHQSLEKLINTSLVYATISLFMEHFTSFQKNIGPIQAKGTLKSKHSNTLSVFILEHYAFKFDGIFRTKGVIE